MTKARVVVLLAVIVLWPVAAQAADGWWAWLEELSGPGYFTGPMYSLPVKCWQDGEPTTCGCGLFRTVRYDKSIRITVGWLSSGDRARFKDLPAAGKDDPNNHRRVIAIPLNAALMFRPQRSIDIGPGAGVLLFAGQDVNVHARLVLIPVSASWKFLLSNNDWEDTHWRRAFALEFQTYYITKGFTGQSFGSSVTTYRAPAELRASVGLSVNLGAWR